ncbi:hypothetical protein NWQ33_01140 [Mycoplasmopsis cynos]|nr:hypothetical protein [Mycoplasmopsis cynos]
MFLLNHLNYSIPKIVAITFLRGNVAWILSVVFLNSVSDTTDGLFKLFTLSSLVVSLTTSEGFVLFLSDDQSLPIGPCFANSEISFISFFAALYNSV